MKERQERKPFVEPKLIRGEKLDKVTFQPTGYSDPAGPSGFFHPYHLHKLSHTRGHHK